MLDRDPYTDGALRPFLAVPWLDLKPCFSSAEQGVEFANGYVMPFS
jgi:hypothetical protein